MGLPRVGGSDTLRASCKELRQLADTCLDAARLCLPFEGGNRAPDKRDSKNMAAVCRRLTSLRELKVIYFGMINPMKITLDQCVTDCQQFTAALGNSGLTAKSLKIVLAYDRQLPVAALAALLKAVPRLQTLTIKLSHAPSNRLALLLKELQRCQQLTSVTIECTSDDSTLPEDASEAVCQQLHSLLLPRSWSGYESDAPIALRLLDSLPQLST